MSLGPRYGVCLHCGHDHGEPGSFFPPNMERMVTAHVVEMKSKTDRITELERALQELVDCKDLKDAIDREATAQQAELHEEYSRRKPAAWTAARTVLANSRPATSAPHQPASGEKA